VALTDDSGAFAVTCPRLDDQGDARDASGRGKETEEDLAGQQADCGSDAGPGDDYLGGGPRMRAAALSFFDSHAPIAFSLNG
jgi:hypothetical protein